MDAEVAAARAAAAACSPRARGKGSPLPETARRRRQSPGDMRLRKLAMRQSNGRCVRRLCLRCASRPRAGRWVHQEWT
eukprot:9036304-Pyramimonas_sp.AAC.1